MTKNDNKIRKNNLEKKDNIKPLNSEITNKTGTNCLKVAGFPNFLFTNGLNNPY